MSDDDDVMDELARARGRGEDYSIVHDSHAVAAAIEASPAARAARRKAYEAVKAGDQAAWEAAADEAATALPFVNATMVGLVLGAQVLAMLRGYRPIEQAKVRQN